MIKIDEDYFIKRNTWRPGLWNDEPDKVEWRSSTNPAFPCLIVRGYHGALCGYVGVDKNHPYYGKHHDSIEDIEVHGGLIYSNKCQEDGMICHVPLNNESDDVWWLGFDCAHSDDYVPMIGQFVDRPTNYRNIEYVIDEISRLAEQLAAIKLDSE
jgi:hypothetical protein